MLNHSALPGMGEDEDIYVCSQIFFYSFGLHHTSQGPVSLRGGPPAPFLSRPAFSLAAAAPGPLTFLALVSMLAWVRADVAGEALVVWETEAGPVALDPIAALEGRCTEDQGGRRTSTCPRLTPHFLGLALSPF